MHTDTHHRPGLVAWVIDQSLSHKGWVLIGALALSVLAGWFTWHLKIDALPDLSDTQVIVKAEFPGQPPRLVEDQVTYPLTTALLGVPGARTVRAFSMFGEAFAYVVFHEGMDPEKARSRVLERTTQLQTRLPNGASLTLGPDASGTGWIYQYALVSTDASIPHDRLRAIQEFQLRPALQSVAGVAEIATFGGTGRQLQVDVDPDRLQTLGLTTDMLAQALRDANQARGGGALEMGRQRFFISSDARINSPQTLLDAPIGRDANGQVLRLRQVARASFGPAPREGVADMDGQGDVVGGIVVMRQGDNAARTIHDIKQRLHDLQATLPKGVQVQTTYDRSTLIHQAIDSLGWRLLEEAAVVATVCLLFLWRLRSALVAIVSLPVGLLVALALLQWQGITANIMSLGGLAIAIGAMIDASVVMVETLHRKLEAQGQNPTPHWTLVRECAQEVGPALFFSLLVITVSFLPVFSLQGQEGRLFSPLALTKTYAMAAAACLSVTLVPVLMGLFVKGPVRKEHRNPLNRALKKLYRPALKWSLAHPKSVIGMASIVILSALWPLHKMGSEFMPPLDEGDLLYMPTTLPSVSVDEAADILRRTSAIIQAQPEVAHVHGKAGRSDSATDPAPLSMIESTVQLKPREQWPDPKLKSSDLMARLDQQVQIAGLTRSWGHPIRTRIDMLSTGVKTPLALRITGADLATVQTMSEQAEQALRSVPGIRGAFAERAGSGRFIHVEIDRSRASLYGIRPADIHRVLEGPVGGMPVDTFTAGREHYPIVIRFPRDDRQSLNSLARLRVPASDGGSVTLSQVASIHIGDGPIEIRSDNAAPVGYVLLDLDDADVGGVLTRAQTAVASALPAQSGYQLEFVGQYLRLKQASTRLWSISAATLACVVLILYVHFRSWARIAIVMASLPCAGAGAVWLCFSLGLQWSFATVVGGLALAGVAAEFCVVMLLYLDQELERSRHDTQPGAALRAIQRGALMRLRPKAMTVAVILGGLIPILVSDGVGVDVMKRIAAPLMGGMLTAPLFSLLVVPALYRLTHRNLSTEEA